MLRIQISDRELGVMSLCTKFKIVTWIPSAGLRIQPYGTGDEIHAKTKTATTRAESIKNTLFNAKSHVCSKSDVKKNCFASGANAKYMEYLFSKWLKNVYSVHKSWNMYFSELTSGTSNAKKSAATKQESKVMLEACVDDVSKREVKQGSIEDITQSNLTKLESQILSADSSNSWPPLPPQEQTCVVGHINLSPFNATPSQETLHKPKNLKHLIKNTSKSAEKSNESVNTQQLEEKELLQNAEPLKTAPKAEQKEVNENPSPLSPKRPRRKNQTENSSEI